MRYLRANWHLTGYHARVYLCLMLLGVTGAAAFAAREAPAISDAEVTLAVAAIAADPNMGGERKTHTLQFHPSDTATQPHARPGWLAWLEGAFRWLASSGRLVFWILVSLLAALLLVLLLRSVRRPRVRFARAHEALATHVGTYDIRPESLPADIGAAARALWDAGKQREALSLLYRGTLSHLVHRHAVPIHDSNTEAECATLAATRLTPERAHFVAQLIDCWVRAVYAERMPASSLVHDLCGNFGALLDTAPEAFAGAGS